jgi:hypothetical protein
MNRGDYRLVWNAIVNWNALSDSGARADEDPD